jgi:hypothetical protein
VRIFLACTPRTGNLWIRRVIAHALDLTQFCGHKPDEIDWDLLPERCLVAMHWHYSDEFAAFLRARGFRIIVTTRHPLDVLVSILRFAALEPATARWLDGECGDEGQLAHAEPASTEFAQYCLGDRADALLRVSWEWRDHADVVVRYEDFLRAPADVTAGILRDLDVQPVAPIEDAVRANAMDVMRPLAMRHIWRGRSGDWKRIVTMPIANGIGARHRPYFKDFGYACDPDPFLDADTARRNWEQMLMAG